MAWIRLENNFCVYCGTVADSEEHFPPRSDATAGVILPACRECNSIAGTIWPHDFRKRAKHVISQLTKKYESEIDRLDSDIAHYEQELTRCQKIRNQLSERLAWNAVSHISSIDTGNNFAPIIAEDFTTQGSARDLCERTAEAGISNKDRCVTCGASVEKYHANQRFCSNECRFKWNNDNRRELVEWARKQKGAPKLK